MRLNSNIAVKNQQSSAWASVVLLLPLVIIGCATISAYDPTSYKNATDLKAESLLLVQEATDPASKHADEINKVMLQLQQDYEYEKGKGKLNTITTQEWEKLANPKGRLLGGFLARWESQNQGLSPTVISDASKNISDAFDEIIRLERNKVKP